MKLYRQGDVLIRQISALPEGQQKAIPTGILAYGEVTGHCHKIEKQQAAELLDVGGGMYLNVTAEGGVSIVHDEHSPIVLSPGSYEVIIQKEYTPEAIRNVAD